MSSEASTSAAAGHAGIGGVLSQAWTIVRHSRPLWWLGAVSAAQAMVYSAVVMLMILPSVALPQLVIPLQAASSATSADTVRLSALSGAFLSGSEAVVRFLPEVIAGIVVLFCVWIVSGVFDVAAQVGVVTQVAEERRGRRASTRAGLSDGFGVWWQTIGLLAVAALPALVLVLGIGVSTLFTYTLPLMRGELPNTATVVSGQLLLAPLQSVVSIVSVALGVIVQLALRFVALERAPWRRALFQGWAMARAHLADVALTYLFATVVGIPVVLASTLVVGVIAAIVAGFVLAAIALTGVPGLAAVSVGVVAVAVVATPVVLTLQALFLAWYSAVWTVLWQGVRSGDVSRATVRPLSVEGTHSVVGTVFPGQL